jgi:hypothetical protein
MAVLSTLRAGWERMTLTWNVSKLHSRFWQKQAFGARSDSAKRRDLVANYRSYRYGSFHF